MTPRAKLMLALVAIAALGWFLALTSMSAVRSARMELDCASNYTIAQELSGDIPQYCKDLQK